MLNLIKYYFMKNIKNVNSSNIARRINTYSDDEVEKNSSKLLQDLKTMLRRKQVSTKDGFTCLQTECFICPGNKMNEKIYINKKTGNFSCPSCEYNASVKDVLELYKNILEKNLITAKAKKDTYNFDSDNTIPLTANHVDLLKNSIFSNLDIKVLESLSVRYNTEKNTLHFPLRNSIGLIVGEKIYDAKLNTEETLPSSNSSGLISYSASNPKSRIKKAVLVLNIKDFCTLSTEKLIDSTVICLPYGLSYLPQECLPSLENYNQLIFWFDFDVISWDTAKNFGNKLNEKRCLYVRPTKNQKNPYGALKRKINIEHVLNTAKPLYHESITTFNKLKEDVLSEIQNIEKVNGVKWNRFPQLNKLLKGHRKGELTLLTGPTGSGKTTFMSEYSLDLATQGVTTLWGSFEIRNIRLAATLLRQFAGFPLNEKLNEFDYWSNKFEKLPFYFMTFHGEQPLKKVMEAIDYAQYVHDIQHVIIDNVQFMLGVSSGGFKKDKFYEQDVVISTFRSFATLKNVHVTLVMHPRKEKDSDDLSNSSIFGSAKATQEADNVLIIQDNRLTSVRGKKFLQVTKNRYSGDLGIMPLTFDKEGLSYRRIVKEVKNKEPNT